VSVSVSLQAQEPTAQDLEDYTYMWGAMLLVLVVAWGLRKVADIFGGKFDGT
jgi:flagellar biogenesis protein FliO